MGLQFTFWGVRGSLPCAGENYVTYGGSTSCIEVETASARFILDSGSGIRALGDKIMTEHKSGTGKTQQALLFSHTHWDHIIGFPFFKPLFFKEFTFAVMGGHLQNEGGIRTALDKQMQAPFFPVGLDVMQAEMQFKDFTPPYEFDLFDAHIRTAPLNHPNGATGYRIDHDGKSVCYVTDTEHFADRLDDNILTLIEGADAVIYDCAYTEEEYENRQGWGHSTWKEGLKLCQSAGAKHLYIFHHDPSHDDKFMAEVEKQALATSDICRVAKENMTVKLS